MMAIALMAPVAAPVVPLEETRQTLVDSARRRFGAIATDALVDHVLRRTDGSDFAVREAALEARSFAAGASRSGTAWSSPGDRGRVAYSAATQRPAACLADAARARTRPSSRTSTL
jgi:hypothetical protein